MTIPSSPYNFYCEHFDIHKMVERIIQRISVYPPLRFNYYEHVAIFDSYFCLCICTSTFIVIGTFVSFMHQVSFIHQDISSLKIISCMH